MRTKLFLSLASAVSVCLAAGAANAAVTKYVATFTGAQETPSVKTAATGTASLDFDDTTRKLTGTVTFTGINNDDVNGQHIHKGACGVPGGPVVILPAPASQMITVNVTLTPADATSLATGDLYINIHTAANPDGIIRGQLYA